MKARFAVARFFKEWPAVASIRHVFGKGGCGPPQPASLAEEFGVSRERVRQIDVSAFEKVQKAVRNRVAAMESPAALPVH